MFPFALDRISEKSYSSDISAYGGNRYLRNPEEIFVVFRPDMGDAVAKQPYDEEYDHQSGETHRYRNMAYRPSDLFFVGVPS